MINGLVNVFGHNRSILNLFSPVRRRTHNLSAFDAPTTE